MKRPHEKSRDESGLNVMPEKKRLRTRATGQKRENPIVREVNIVL